LITSVLKNKISKLNIYPNPTQDMVELSKAVDWKLINVMGVEVESAVNSNSVDLTKYAEGIYYLIIGGNSFKIIKK